MGLELMPKADIPYVTVVTVYPGASPEEFSGRRRKTHRGRGCLHRWAEAHVSSTCMENICQTLLEFQLDVDVDIAATEEPRQAARLDGKALHRHHRRWSRRRTPPAAHIAMAKLNTELPGGMDLVWIDDDGTFIGSQQPGRFG